VRVMETDAEEEGQSRGGVFLVVEKAAMLTRARLTAMCKLSPRFAENATFFQHFSENPPFRVEPCSLYINLGAN
jgi:hypothetical protein